MPFNQQTGESLFIDLARNAYRSVRGGYRTVRAVRNYFLNAVDCPLIILVYHRVADLPSDPEMLAVSPENFRAQMKFLKENFEVLRFEEDWRGLKEPAVVITFDDGYADNALEALPVLADVGVPATFFISTGHLGRDQELWWHRLEGILLREGDFPSRFELKDASYGRAWPAASLDQRKRLYATLVQLMKRIDAVRREEWLDQLVEWSDRKPVSEGAHRSMTHEELRVLAASPWTTVGAHTVTHSALSALSEEQQRQEIFDSKMELECITGGKISTFSYPFGRKVDYNRTSVRLCREAGFSRAASNFPGQVHRWSDPYQLPRHLVRNWDEATFSTEFNRFWTR